MLQTGHLIHLASTPRISPDDGGFTTEGSGTSPDRTFTGKLS